MEDGLRRDIICPWLWDSGATEGIASHSMGIGIWIRQVINMEGNNGFRDTIVNWHDGLSIARRTGSVREKVIQIFPSDKALAAGSWQHGILWLGRQRLKVQKKVCLNGVKLRVRDIPT